MTDRNVWTDLDSRIVAASIQVAGLKYGPSRGEDDSKTALRIVRFAETLLTEIALRMPPAERSAATDRMTPAQERMAKARAARRLNRPPDALGPEPSSEPLDNETI